MNYTPEEVAELLKDKPQQPHYIAAMIRKCIEADRLAALAGAEAVAWMRRSVKYKAVDGRTDGERVVSERKVYEDDIPLFTHAPAKAREVTDADVERACAEYESEHWLDSYDAMRAALATFAEGAE